MAGSQRDRESDRVGFESTTNYLTTALARIVPDWVAERAVTVRISTEDTRYNVGEPIDINVEFDNRLPVPVQVPTPGKRRWGWSVDGVIEADEAPRYHSGDSLTFQFRAGETKRITTTWDGRFRRETNHGLDRSVPADPGFHTIEAFLATAAPDVRAAATTEIRIG